MSIFLETQRLLIKAPTPADFNHWCAVHADTDLNPISKDVIKTWLDYHIKDYKKNGFSMGSVYLKNTNTFIGRAGLFYYIHPDGSKPDVEMGYVLHKAYWNQGYATELAHALIHWGFTHLNIDKLIALTREDNNQSKRVLEKVGMHYVKKIRSEGDDFLLYEVLKHPNG